MRRYRIQGLVLAEHEFSVPLDHSRSDGETLTVFAREARAAGNEDADLPWLVFLQGGPGSAAARPTGLEPWILRATRDYHLLLLDQRGTGRSTPVSAQTLARLGSAAGAGRLPEALPGRLDRARRRGHPPADHGRRAVGAARPELRRLLCDHVPLDRAGGRARGVRDRRAASARALRRRGLPGDVQAARRPEPPLLRALPGGRRARARAGGAARLGGRAPSRTARGCRRAACSRSARSSA